MCVCVCVGHWVWMSKCVCVGHWVWMSKCVFVCVHWVVDDKCFCVWFGALGWLSSVCVLGSLFVE